MTDDIDRAQAREAEMLADALREQARRAGLVVDRVITLIDREEGGRENILQRADCVESVFTRTQIMALREEILSGQQRT